jgi:hypothetical protein
MLSSLSWCRRTVRGIVDTACQRCAQITSECKLIKHTDREVSISILEVLEMDDLPRVVLESDRGFSSKAFPTGPHSVEAADLDSGVLTALLPDDAEESGEQREWEWLADIANGRAISVTAAELRALPSRIEDDHLAT